MKNYFEMKYTIDDQIKEISREIGMRRSVYPRQIELGKMSKSKANEKIAIMESVLDRLQKIKGKVENQSELFS